MSTDHANETSAERKRRLARERKARQREREKRLGMAPLRLEYAAAERQTIADMTRARGFEDQAEYLYALVRADARLLARDSTCNPAMEVVTCHA